MFSDLGKQRRRGNIQSQFLWKVSGRSNLIKKPLPDWYSDRGKVTRQPCKSRVLRIISSHHLRINRKDGQMISVLDVLTIFVSGFIAAKVCDYVHGLEESEE